ncbi:hypothetical protein TMEN_8905 [Trichophyton mentagrophytes]|uniref:Uncharacterized protein n=1 Tax=Trichophyton interdigitale (strain MR816) TaxID=1215338 RepID=A0A059JD64_TRIIM|nr:hypothetical protein H101_03162 [Trichophyton interdigitale H6]KAG5209898.1 hypothetical protein GY631_5325 [Trichophyton interdigitale]KDB25709.1 hypothetical protein H109_02496 [Trichophyton interdigitale MR816]GBF66185.1 hypothetical protein TMEN_8905 [Trichophyton mentagrophytes]KAG5218671.1 hypothetical protein GY632_5320 [Trichophyton interdigitale]
MASPSTMESAAPTANPSPEVAREPAKKKQKVIPGLEPGYFVSQESLTSEYFPIEGLYGEKIPATAPLATEIWRDYEDDTKNILSPIKIHKDSGEPGIQFEYKCLNVMIVNFPKGLPENFKDAFAGLANARVYYFAAHEAYRKEKKGLAEEVAISEQLRWKREDIRHNPELYEPGAAGETRIALMECIAECRDRQMKFQNKVNCLKFFAGEFIEAKKKAAPFEFELRKYYAGMKEAYIKAKEAEAKAKRLEKEKAEKERSQKARAEKERLDKQKHSRDRVMKERRQRADAATRARLDHDAKAWAEYLARSERMRNGANAAAHGGKQ